MTYSPIKPYWWRPIASGNRLYHFSQLRPWLKLQKFSRGFRNFGDELNSVLLSSYFPQHKIFRTSINSANFLAIGSIIEISELSHNEDLRIWGSGLRNGDQAPKIDPKNVLALRGKLSAEKLHSVPDIALGDPALLISKLFNGVNLGERQLTVFAPHFSFFQLPIHESVLRQLFDRDFVILWPNIPPAEGIDIIRSAKLVLSSALHPLILSDAFGVPAIRLEGMSPFESSFKYLDYLSVIGSEIPWPTMKILDFMSGTSSINQSLPLALERVDFIAPDLKQTQIDLIESLVSR